MSPIDSPSKSGDEHAHHEGADQASNGEDRHSEWVHECQLLPIQSRPISTHNGAVIKVLNVLGVCKEEKEKGKKYHNDASSE